MLTATAVLKEKSGDRQKKLSDGKELYRIDSGGRHVIRVVLYNGQFFLTMQPGG